MPDEPRVVFTPSGRRGPVVSGTTVLDAARGLGVDLDSVCGGRGICGRCQVVPVAGDFPKHGLVSAIDHLSATGATEEQYRSKKGLATDRRLGCMAAIRGDVVVDVPPESQVHRQVVRKRVEVEDLVIDPVIRLYYVTVTAPTLERAAGDVQRLLAALRDEWRLELDVAAAAVAELQSALGAAGGAVTAAVRDGDEVVAVWPGYWERALGVAVDVGSTTIAAHLVDLASGTALASAGRMNPQIRFGEDLMSRVSHVMLHPEGADQLTSTVRGAIDELIGELVDEAGVDRGDILELTVVGNPVMHHFLLGYDTRPLGEAPFAPATDAALDLRAAELDLAVHPAARVYVLPLIAGHVGADTAAAILSEAPHHADEVSLVVDVGTNAEIVLGDRRGLVAASSPTGPAFEGAQISSGQRAAPGAIERVRIDRGTLEPRFRVIGVDAWSDEEAFGDTPATGICGSGIIEAVAELFLCGLLDADGKFAADAPDRTDRMVADGRTHSYRLTESVLITQNDVRAIQLAKAALYAGVRLLMDHLDIDTVEQIRLAGAFGSHIDPTYAMVLGLVPDCDLSKVSAAGNAAGAGALIALLSGDARRDIERVVRSITKIETAVEPRFQEHFVEAMAFPHRSAEFPNLAAAIDLPARQQPAGVRRRRRSREASS